MAQQSPLPAKHPPHKAPKWYIESLEFFREVAGLPALVAIILELLRDLIGLNTVYVKIGTAIALLIAIGLRFFLNLRVSTVLPLLLSAVLTTVLIVFVVPFRAKEDSNSLASSWLEGEKNLEESVGTRKISSPPIGGGTVANDRRGKLPG